MVLRMVSASWRFTVTSALSNDRCMEDGTRRMMEPFIDCTRLEGQRRIRSYVLGWLERLDYAGRLDRSWPADALGQRVWERIDREYSVAWGGPVVSNQPLAAAIAATMVDDYYEAYPERRSCRYSVAGPLPDDTFRRSVLDFVQDLEEYEPTLLPGGARAAADAFWKAVHSSPERWGYRLDGGCFVDDEVRAKEVVVDVIEEYFALLVRAARRRSASAGEPLD